MSEEKNMSVSVSDSPKDSHERIDRFQSLAPGEYWKSLVSRTDYPVDEGMVLLIQEIDLIDNSPHTVKLRPHPSQLKPGLSIRTYDLRIEDFLDNFEFEANGTSIREQEVSKINGDVDTLREEIIEAQKDPRIIDEYVSSELAKKQVKQEDGHKALAISSGVPVPRTIGDALSAGLDANRIAEMKQSAETQLEVAKLKSGWLQNKTSVISEKINSIVPFYEEQAAVALAQTSAVRHYIESIKNGIQTLDLYVGTGVEVHTIKEGLSADASEPLTVLQKRLIMDEEMSLHADIHGHFSVHDKGAFFTMLAENDALLTQVLPFPRCVCVMATSLEHRSYGKDPYYNGMMNEANKQSFFLVRDGENVHVVYSPIPSHLMSEKLFPTKDELDRIFTGFNGEDITFDDIRYTSSVKLHDNVALHYKRFLILICGLDHRLNLFGDFYPGGKTFKFVSHEFQHEHMRFIADMEPSLATIRPGLFEWIDQHNKNLSDNSWIACNLHQAVTQESTPSMCVSVGHGHYHLKRPLAQPVEMFNVGKIDPDGNFKISAQFSNRDGDGTRGATVTLNTEGGRFGGYSSAFICIDHMTAEDLRWYMQDRKSRASYGKYMKVAKFILPVLEQRDEAIDSLISQFNLTSDVDFFKHALRLYGLKRKTFQLDQSPDKIKKYIDAIVALKAEEQSLQDHINGAVPGLIALTVGPNGKPVVYFEAPEDLRDNRVSPHTWVMRKEFGTIKAWRAFDGRADDASMVSLSQQSAHECIIFKSDLFDRWSAVCPYFDSYEKKAEFLNQGQIFWDELLEAKNNLDSASELLTEIMDKRRSFSKSSVVEPKMRIPIAAFIYDGDLCTIDLKSVNLWGLICNMIGDRNSMAHLQELYGCFYRHPRPLSALHFNPKAHFDIGTRRLDESREAQKSKLVASCNSSEKYLGYPLALRIEKEFEPLKEKYVDGSLYWMVEDLRSNGTDQLDKQLGISEEIEELALVRIFNQSDVDRILVDIMPIEKDAEALRDEGGWYSRQKVIAKDLGRLIKSEDYDFIRAFDRDIGPVKIPAHHEEGMPEGVLTIQFLKKNK